MFGYDGDLWSVIHLMIAGRLHWADAGRKPPGRKPLLEFQFSTGKLTLTEAGSKRRASLHLVRGADALAAHDPGGIEPLAVDAAAFARALRSANHTLKRALTDPHLISGIGNAYSDEILHRARLSPIALTQKLGDAELEHLFDATQDVLREWIERLRAQAGDGFPEGVTAFRPEMAVHGRYREPCPVCGSPVQRIVHAENETNYCARCQTGGQAARGPRAVAPAQSGLAAHVRRAGSAALALGCNACRCREVAARARCLGWRSRWRSSRSRPCACACSAFRSSATKASTRTSASSCSRACRRTPRPGT